MSRRRDANEPPRITFRGTPLTTKQRARIRELVEQGAGRTRQDLAREVCRTFSWRRPNGAWAVRNARDVLVRLERAGVIRLPAPRRAQGRPRREEIEASAAALGSGYASALGEPSADRGSGQELVVRPIRSGELLGWRAHMERFHYLGDAALVGESICAVLAGARSVAGIAEYGREQSRDTLERIGSRHGKPPSERTIGRTLGSIDTEELDRSTSAWIAQQQERLSEAGVALDGKTVRGSGDGDQPPLHLLSAIVHESGTMIGQTAVESKTNEITKVAPLLDGLDLEGAAITADALLAQREIARHIVEDEHADYVFTIKDNQPTLRQDIEDLFVSEQQDARRLQGAAQKPPHGEAFPP